MISNYLRIALRTLGKNKIYSFINIFGFAIGITCTLLILLWVNDELSYDSWNPKKDRVFKMMVRAHYDGKINVWNANPMPAKDAVREEDPRIVNSVVTDWGMDHLLAVADKAERLGIKKKGMYVSEAYLDMFMHPVLKGDGATALTDMKSIVLTESTAKELFGDREALDKIVRLDDGEELKVTAIIRDVPGNSNDHFDFLTTWKLREQNMWVKKNKDRWDSYSVPVYIELSDPSQKAEVEEKLKGLLAKHGETDFRKEFMLQQASRWHLYSNFENGEEAGGQIVYVRTFGIVAALILFIACVNFMNLSTARAEKRAIEVGVRKSIGSRRSDLISQFIWESIMTTAIAFVLGVVFAQLLLPFYNQLVSKQLFIPYTSWVFVGGSLLTIGVVGVFAGSYPAFYLSAFKPTSVLKGGKSVGRGATLPRKILVTLQFGLSMVLMIATAVVYQQINYVKDRDLGYEPDNMLIMNVNDDLVKNYKAMKGALLQTGVVEAVTQSSASITELSSWSPVDWPGKPADQRYFFAALATEYDYVKTMGLKLLQGRDFSEEFKSDSAACILNRAAIDLIGTKDPIGMKVGIGGRQYEVIGVLENTISGSPYETVGPMILSFVPQWTNAITIRLAENVPLTESLKKVEAVVKTYSPAYPFDFKFADDAFQQKFVSINLTSRLSSIFSILTLVITGLGLFGLAAFTAAQRTREMGIRKVMGASVQQLVQLVTTDFSVLVVVAFILASPLGWWLVEQYLQQYPYRVDFQWWVLPATGIGALLFAVLIVSTQALRAARSNPAQSLRSE